MNFEGILQEVDKTFNYALDGDLHSYLIFGSETSKQLEHKKTEMLWKQ